MNTIESTRQGLYIGQPLLGDYHLAKGCEELLGGLLGLEFFTIVEKLDGYGVL